MSQYEDLRKKFDGTLKSVPPEVEGEILDHYADAENLQAFCGEYDIPPEIVRVVLEQPDLLQRALDRQRGALTLQFVSKVLPAAMKKAAGGDTGAIQAAKLVADAIGVNEGRPVGRPPKSADKPESGESLESRLRKVADIPSGEAPKRTTPRRTASANPRSKPSLRRKK